MRPLHPILTAPCGGYRLEAIEAGRTQGGLQASVRVVETGAVPGTLPVRRLEVVHLADAGERKTFAALLLRAIDPITPGAPTATEWEGALLALHDAIEAAMRALEVGPLDDGTPTFGGGLYAACPLPIALPAPARPHASRAAVRREVFPAPAPPVAHPDAAPMPRPVDSGRSG
jgi:hypothetical protein